jgi:hypothetical protein
VSKFLSRKIELEKSKITLSAFNVAFPVKDIMGKIKLDTEHRMLLFWPELRGNHSCCAKAKTTDV